MSYCDNSTVSSDGRRVVGARALGRVARACSIASCVAGRCCLLGSTPLSTIRSVCHMISTNQPIGRCATDRAADPSGRCRSGRRFVLQQRLTFSFNVGSLRLNVLTFLPSNKKLSMIHLFEILSPVRRTREYCHASSHQLHHFSLRVSVLSTLRLSGHPHSRRSLLCGKETV